jgi:hypothetical protein
VRDQTPQTARLHPGEKDDVQEEHRDRTTHQYDHEDEQVQPAPRVMAAPHDKKPREQRAEIRPAQQRHGSAALNAGAFVGFLRRQHRPFALDHLLAVVDLAAFGCADFVENARAAGSGVVQRGQLLIDPATAERKQHQHNDEKRSPSHQANSFTRQTRIARCRGLIACRKTTPASPMVSSIGRRALQRTGFKHRLTPHLPGAGRSIANGPETTPSCAR